MNTPHQGTAALIELAEELRTAAPHVREGYDLGHGSRLMHKAADVLAQLAPLDPEIEVVRGEH